jgi:HEAT repeat protein
MAESQTPVPRRDGDQEQGAQEVREFLEDLKSALNSDEAAVRGEVLDWLEGFFAGKPDVRTALVIRAGAREGVLERMRDDDASVRAKAIAVAGVALETWEAVDVLVELAKDAESAVRELALRSLRRVGPLRTPSEISAVADALTSAAKDAERTVRTLALEDLPRFGRVCPGQVVSALVGAAGTKEPEAELRRAAIAGLRGADHDAASAAVPVLTRALVDTDVAVRGEAVSTLAWLGPEAPSAVPAIVELVLGEQPLAVRAAAVGALLAIDPEHQLALPRLAKIKGEMTREKLLKILCEAGPSGRSLRRRLQAVWVMEQADEDDQAIRRAAGPEASTEQPHPNGPDPPNTFWWKGKPLRTTPKACDLLGCLWEKEKVDISDIAPRVWRKKKPSPQQIKSALQEIRSLLLLAGVPWKYGKKGGYILKQ